MPGLRLSGQVEQSMKAESLKRLALLSCSTLFALGLGEAYLRWNAPRWLYFETRNIVQQDFSEPGPGGSPSYLPKANAEGRFRNREFDTHVRINSQRMRADRDYAYSRSGETTRIVAVGNSFVFGWGVEVHETTISLLERHLSPGVEVLNLGVSGYSARNAWERLQYDGVLFRPDLVLFFVSQFPWAVSESYVFLDGRLYWNSDPPRNSQQKAISFARRHSDLFAFLYEAPSRIKEGNPLGWKSPTALQTSLPVLETAEMKEGLDLLDQLQVLGRREGFVPIVVLVPDKEDVEAVLNANGGARAETTKLREYCHSRKLGLVDLTSPLRDSWSREGKCPYFDLDDHWNAQGHRVAAAAIAAFLHEGFVSRHGGD
jgi:hypothetical protein